jgi:hypothetical protein
MAQGHVSVSMADAVVRHGLPHTKETCLCIQCRDECSLRPQLHGICVPAWVQDLIKLLDREFNGTAWRTDGHISWACGQAASNPVACEAAWRIDGTDGLVNLLGL